MKNKKNNYNSFNFKKLIYNIITLISISYIGYISYIGLLLNEKIIIHNLSLPIAVLIITSYFFYFLYQSMDDYDIY